MQLTDQALLAVTLARRAAAGRPASVAHLLVGLAGEPDGAAAAVFRRRDAAAAQLAARGVSASARLPSLETAVGWAAGEVHGRPLWTTDLLAAALEVGGRDLAELLAACGLAATDLATEPPEALSAAAAVEEPGALAETRGYDPADASWSLPAARAVARARAIGGGAVALLVALAAEAALDPEEVPVDGDALADRLRRRAPPLRCDRPGDDDRGLDRVVEAARRIGVAGRPLTATDLLRAAALAGGARPAALLAPSEDAP